MVFVGHQAGQYVNNDNSDGMVAIGYQAGQAATQINNIQFCR